MGATPDPGRGIVGRAAELARLDAAIARAAVARTGGVVLICGIAGDRQDPARGRAG